MNQLVVMTRWWWCCPRQKPAEENGRVVERWRSLLRLSQWPNCWPSHRPNIITDLWKMESKKPISQGLGDMVSSLLTAASASGMFSMSISTPYPPHPFLLASGVSSSSSSALPMLVVNLMSLDGPGWLYPGVWACSSPLLLRAWVSAEVICVTCP